MDPAQEFEERQIARHMVVNDTIARFDSPVQRFYEGAVVFVTGASGFLGKQLIEKLFRSCKIAKVYILLRPKKNKTFEERIQDLTKDPVYEFLKKSQPNFWEKIVPVQGDISEIGLGLSEHDRKTITEQVTIIFHGAATINFVESMKTATHTNVRGTIEMIKLGKESKKLKAFVHISTAYSHATYTRVGKDVQEDFYPSPISPLALIELSDTLDDEQMNNMTPKLIQNWPNTYAFTKAVAEEAVRTMSGDLPICIVRPAIVICALREPVPGWIDPGCAYGPTGILLGTGLGVIHVVQCREEANLDLVPVDLVNNAVIAAAPHTVRRRQRNEKQVQIYTLTGTRNPMSFGYLISIIKHEARYLASDKSVMYGSACSTANTLVYMFLSYLFHIIPAFLVDGILRLLGKKPMLMKVYQKMKKLNVVLSYYMTNDWHFKDSNLREVYWQMSPTDRLIFDCNTDTVDWMEYVQMWAIGTRKYIVKDGINRTHVGVKKQFYFKILTFVLLPLYFYVLYKLFYYSAFILYSVLSLIFYFIF